MLGNTLFCWQEKELHGMTALPKEGVTCNFSQNLAKRTVTVIKKWREGTEAPKHVNYHLNHLLQDLPAREALVNSVEKNNERRNNEVVLEGGIGYEGSHINVNASEREWIE